METGNIPFKTERVPDPSDVLNESKVGRGARHVRNVSQDIRCVPPHLYAGLSRIPLLLSQGQALYVLSTSFRFYDGPVGFHSGGESCQDMVDKASSHPVPILRRLFKSIQIVEPSEMNDTFSETCEELVVLVNQERSELQPTQTCVLLGEKLDLVQGRAFPTEERQKAVVPALSKALTHHDLHFSAAESLLGLVSATAPTTSLGRMHMSRLRH